MDSLGMTVKKETGVEVEEEDVKPLPSGLAKLTSNLLGSTLGDSLKLPNLGEGPSRGESSDDEDSHDHKEHPAADLKGQSQGQKQGSEVQQPATAGHDDSLRPPSPQMAVCPSGFIPKISPPVNEKRERDETWKKFLTR